MIVYEIDKPQNKEFLKELNVDEGGVSILSDKMDYMYIYIKNLKTPAVNILKQDALSVRCDVAVPKGVILCKKEYYNCLLFGNRRDLKKLSFKLKAQAFGLKDLSKSLEEILNAKEFNNIKIMGVINANSDSFYKGSRFLGEEAISKIEQMIEDGADIIDIGAVSSRPGSIQVDKDEELRRVRNILDLIKEKKLYEKITFSIDSYTPKVVEYALNCGFNIINDITGAKDDKIIKLAINYNAKLCIMHMQGTPQTMQKNPNYIDVVYEVDKFFKERINKCEQLGLNKNNIILDVGIGFGKTLEHNIALLKSHKYFTHFGCELLIGASRKSMIDMIIPTKIEDRLPGTLAIHLKAISRGASIVRCHDVKEHKQAIEVYKKL